MKKAGLIKLIVVLLIVGLLSALALCGLEVSYWRIKPLGESIQLGLDLRGGVYALYEAVDTSSEEFETQMTGAVGVLRNRLDASGYSEANVMRQGSNRIRIEIPDVDDPNEILNILGQPAKLELIDPNGDVVLDGSDIESAYATTGEGNLPVVAFTLSPEGATAFAEATQKYLNQIIEIQLDGEAISTPTVTSVISNGEGIIEGMGSMQEAQTLAIQIMSGALPIELTQVEVRTISATLGADALQYGLLAGAIGVVLILLFMLAFYRLCGLMADIALVVYMLIVGVLLATVPGIQLTLPGIAGVILGIGMAVDANVVIFERITDELRLGKTLRSSINSGFAKAFRSILDANITTLIAAVVLWIFGAGTIRGFAITLFISILASMFTAIVVTRFLLKRMVDLNITNKKLYSRS